MMHYLTLSLIAGFIVLPGCTGKSSNSPHLILGEGGVSSDSLSISSGNVVVEENQPGIAFATITTTEGSKKVAYYVVFNHDRPIADVNSNASCIASRASSANTSHTIHTFGNECTVKYDVSLKEGNESIETERVTISDKEYDRSKGRIFLVDMEATPPNVTQINLDLPANVPSLLETNAAKQFGQDTLNALRKADKTVERFCRSIETRGN